MNAIIELVKKAQKGNSDAFLEIFQHYEQELYRIAFVYVKNQDNALDVMQEVAYKSFKNISALQNPEYFKTWITRITINSSKDFLKANGKVTHIAPEHVDNITSKDKDFLLSVTLEELMNCLNENERTVIMLRFYSGHTFKEISELLDTPMGTLKSWFYRSMEKLRRNVKRRDFYE
ncbi:sigma-70 family RNA polymerase sigma factor [Oceanobacillus massiliensis]|uniref:sigma-70 family RNA polymerase sigma factor n=1 Tax=Oceanobacillus massiliensis TaxID=1465765 RepID=UPI003015E14D